MKDKPFVISSKRIAILKEKYHGRDRYKKKEDRPKAI